MLIFVLAWVGFENAFFNEKKAERLIHSYYKAIIEEDYDKAYKKLYIYDREHIDKNNNIKAGTSLTDDEAKAYFEEKIAYLKKQNYRLLDYQITGVEYEDGHSFWHHVKLNVEIDGERQTYEETADVVNGKLMIGERDDRFAKYRDGKMKINIGVE